jgi:hypothetical protein
MNQDIIYVTRQQRFDENGQELAPILSVQIHFAEKVCLIRTITLRVYTTKFHFVGTGTYDLPGRKTTLCSCTIPVIPIDNHQWTNKYYVIFAYMNWCPFRVKDSVPVDPTFGVTTESYLEKFNPHSWLYYYARETDEDGGQLICYHLQFCDIDDRRREELIHTLCFFNDVETAHSCRYGHSPHFFLAGTDEETSCVASCFRNIIIGRNTDFRKDNEWSGRLSELFGVDLGEMCRQIKLITIYMDQDWRELDELRYDYFTCMDEEVMKEKEKVFDSRCEEFRTFFKSIKSGPFIWSTIFIICASERTYLYLEDFFPNMLVDADFVSPYLPVLGEAEQLPDLLKRLRQK